MLQRPTGALLDRMSRGGSAGIRSGLSRVAAATLVAVWMCLVGVTAARCAVPQLTAPGLPLAWGLNGSGQLGDGSTVNRSTPVPVSGLTDVVAVAAGVGHSLALRTDGTVWAWGSNIYGQLGLGDTSDRLAPVQVIGLTGVIAIAAGGAHSLALRSDGTVWAWGDNQSDQLGPGIRFDPRLTPVQVYGLTGVIAIAAGTFHSLALRSDGTVWAWGFVPPSNPPGDNGPGGHPTPTQVAGLTGVVGIAGGLYHSLALRSDGTVWAWGFRNDYGLRGVGETPAQVSGLTGVVAVASGADDGLALRSDGSVWGWGSNESGQLGVGDTANRLTPVHVGGLTNVVAISGSRGFPEYSLAVRSDGTVWGWGDNRFGELGGGTTDNRLTPMQVSGLADAAAVAAGDGQSLAIRAMPTATRTTLSSSSNPAQPGHTITYTAAVNPIPSGGTVTFTNNGAALCVNQPLSAAGTASCTTSYPKSAAGGHNIVASYSGTTGFTASASTTLTEVITNVSCAEFAGCVMVHERMQGANFAGLDLSKARLVGSDLSGASFTNANLTRANLVDANLSNADFTKADLVGANLTDTTLTGVTWGAGTTCPDGTVTGSAVAATSCEGHLQPR
jgi:alpha-tubulin suppressor-like RCC1 family protein